MMHRKQRFDMSSRDKHLDVRLRFMHQWNISGTCLKKLVMVSVAGLKPVRLQDSSPLVVLSRERRPMMLEFLRSDHEPFLSAPQSIGKHHIL